MPGHRFSATEHTLFRGVFQWLNSKKNHRAEPAMPDIKRTGHKRKGREISRPFKEPDTRHNRYRCFLSDLAGLAALPPPGSLNEGTVYRRSGPVNRTSPGKADILIPREKSPPTNWLHDPVHYFRLLLSHSARQRKSSKESMGLVIWAFMPASKLFL